MTMIACTMNKSTPVVISDLLVSSEEKPSSFILPTHSEDVLQYLSPTSLYYPTCLNQKIYILKSNVCIGFSGTLGYFKQFLEDIRIFCNAHELIDAKIMNAFLHNHEDDESWKHFSFLTLVVEMEDAEYNVGTFVHGQGLKGNTLNFGEVISFGSGCTYFCEEAMTSVKMVSQFRVQDFRHALQTNILMICKLFAKERANLHTVKKHWGAGFELIYWNGNQFQKLDEITYIINYGLFDSNGDILDVPAPIVVMHFKYVNDVLVITVVRQRQGQIEHTDTHYILKSIKFDVKQFFVVPIDYSGSENLSQLGKDASFASNHVGMGYIIETESGHYEPASYNIGSEIEVSYKHFESLTITMLKEINDDLVSEAKQAFNKWK